jgi:hypothetical protein
MQRPLQTHSRTSSQTLPTEHSPKPKNLQKKVAPPQYQTFASWIQRRRHERGDYRMAAPVLKESRRPVPGVRLMEAVMAGPVHPDADGGPALRMELRCVP